MLKFVSSVLLSASMTFVGTGAAQACGGCGAGKCAPAAPTCTAPSCAAPATAPAAGALSDAPMPPNMDMTQRQTYRSYSYDAASANRAPVARSYARPSSSPQGQFRADLKLRGSY